MTPRKPLIPQAAKTAAGDIVERISTLERELSQKASALFDDWGALSDQARRAQEAYLNRRSALRDAFRETQRKLEDPEAAFRLRVELDGALAAIDAEAEAVARDWAERKRQAEGERERAIAARRALSEVLLELMDARLSDYGLAPWDDVALRALRLLGGADAVGEEREPREGALLRAGEVVALFKERAGVSRSLFYARYRHLLRMYSLSPTQLVHRPDGWVELVGYYTTIRFRRTEVNALIAFLGGPAV